jgi:hypothetical protein
MHFGEKAQIDTGEDRRILWSGKESRLSKNPSQNVVIFL